MSPTSFSGRNFFYLGPFLLISIFLLFSGVKSDEQQILLKLKQYFQNPFTNVFNSWDSETPVCKFSGITCDSNGLVQEIELSNRNLTGDIPVDLICELQSLVKISVGYNSLQGVIGKELNDCVKLLYLDLGNNFLSGSFPDISHLSELQFLYLNNSGFSGTFPWKSLLNMTKTLRDLSVGDNFFEPILFPTEVLNLKKLNLLYLSNCSIKGEIPSGIGGFTELEILEVSDNYLTGKIPPEIGNLQNLWKLEMYSNKLTGELPVGFRNLTNLKYLDASRNFLQGNLSELRYLTNIVSIQLFENGFTGEIPAEFGRFTRLVNLSLYTNKLTGPLPSELGSWADFDFIDVSENLLTGPIPPDMCKKGSMRMLLILQNRFTGVIPETYGNCTTLERFRVSNNLLSGSIPGGIWGLPNLNIIDIAVNGLEGGMSSNIKTAKGLAQIYAGKNRLSGQLPDEITEAESLVSVELNDNKFSGEIPGSIGKLKELSSLKLQNNMLSGTIPKTIGSCAALSELNLAHNSFSGGIPPSLGSLPTLNSLNLSNNDISGVIPDVFSSLRLSLLDLSNNRLWGRIPQNLIEAYNGSFTGNNGLCSSRVSSFKRCPSDTKDVRDLIICFAFGTLILLLLLACFLRSKKAKKERSLKDECWDVKSFRLLTFTETEILNSIKQENLIGKGGSGNVYRVALSNGKDLAVKHIWNTDSNGGKRNHSSSPMLGKRCKERSREFEAEVKTLSSIRHVNVVKLYCSITSEDSSLLVYEYMPNGSLWDKLHSCKKLDLDWETRYEIAMGTAKGLEYLHHGCTKPVIHRDVKSSNILLDEFLKPRIADFGLAKILQTNCNNDTTTHVIAGTHGYIAQTNCNNDTTTHVIAGTHGYIAPEYGYTCKVKEKSDVYSFGVVLMELVSGKKPIEAEYGENKDIVSWVSKNLQSRENVFKIVDSRIQKIYQDDVVKVLRIAILCTTTLPTLRPTMRSVVQMLEEVEPRKLEEVVIHKDENSKESEATEKR